jgi:hypothetical protein
VILTLVSKKIFPGNEIYFIQEDLEYMDHKLIKLQVISDLQDRHSLYMEMVTDLHVLRDRILRAGDGK